MAFLYFILYLCFGALCMTFYSIGNNLDMPSSKCRNTKEETSKQFLIWIGWPLYLVFFVYLVAKAAFWFVKNVFLALKFFWDKFFKKETKKEKKDQKEHKDTKDDNYYKGYKD